MIALFGWVGFVCCLTVGFTHGGRILPVNKRSDFSMYDNQFFRVGDTQLDNEVTDCALIRHQYARGYIRLREYLERMQGCGIKGKMQNIAGIAAATKDAVDLPTSVVSSQQNTGGGSAATFKPKPRPIGEVLDNTNHQRPEISAYQNKAVAQTQQGVQTPQTFNNFGFVANENRPLSYLPNPAPNSVQSPLARKLITRKNMDISQKQALSNLNGPKNKKWPNPQRYYSDQAGAMAQPYAAPAVNVGQPIVRPNPFPSAFHQQVQVTSPQAFQPANPDLNIVTPAIKNTDSQQSSVLSLLSPQPQASQPANPDLNIVTPAAKNTASQQSSVLSLLNPQSQASQPANPDLNILKNVQNPVQPVKQVSHDQPGKIRDDINGDDVLDNSMQDEANDATIDNQESDPLPPETSFDYNPNLEEEDTTQQKADAMAQAENSAGSMIPNHPDGSIPMNNAPHDVTMAADDLSGGPKIKSPETSTENKITQQNINETKADDLKTSQQVKTTQQKQVNTTKQDESKPEESNSDSTKQDTTKPVVSKPVASKPVVSKPDTTKPKVLQVKGDDLNGDQRDDKLDEFLKPDSTSNEKIGQADDAAKTNDLSTPQATKSEATDKTAATKETAKKHGGLAINLDVLKNRISSSKDIGFLKRMLTLIKKITHHKDFNKLGGIQKNAIVQAGKAVHNAVTKNDGTFDQRSSIAQRPVTWYPGQYTPQGYVAPSYNPAAYQPAARSFIQNNPPKWKPGDYTTYTSYPSYQSGLQYHPPHWKSAYYTVGVGAGMTPQPQASKKFQVAQQSAQNVQEVQQTAKQVQSPSSQTKKFQIERNPYYRPARPAYTPPYNSLGRISLGLYNGNTP